MRRPLHTLKIWRAGVNSPRSYGAEFVFFCLFFVYLSRYDARHRKPRRCVYALKLGGTGISPRTILVFVQIFVLVLVLVSVSVSVSVFVFVLVLVLVLQQAAPYSIAAVAGN